MLRAARLPGVLLAAAVALAGCGQAAVVPVVNRTIALRLDEYRILPKRVSAPAGHLRLIARNTGILTHNVAVETIPSDPNAQPVVIVRTATLQPGARDVQNVTLKPGTYQLVCTLANHDDLGMTGRLIVK
jgi:plastocyanin